MLKRTTVPALIVLVSLAAAVSGCSDRELKPLNPCVLSNVRPPLNPGGVSQVDLLFVVDSSNSMAEEQAALATEFPRLIEILASGNDGTDPDLPEGFPEFDPVDLQVGVINTDLGIQHDDLADTFSTAGCTVDGQDAIMRSEPVEEVATSDPDCQGLSISPNFLQFAPGDDINAFATDFGCLARVGAQGCFVEQQLEAMLKALTPTDSPITFFGNSTGHGNPDGPNAGFIREGSLVSVIVVSDEDDCSWEDRRLFDLEPPLEYPGGVNARCGLPRNEGALKPLSRYVDGLIDLAPSPELLVFAVIAGIPPEIDDPRAFDTMLGHDDPPFDMQVRVMHPDPRGENEPTDWTTAANPGGEPTLASDLPDTDPDGVDEPQDYDDIGDFPELVPSCLRVVNEGTAEEEQAVAFPPRRFVQTAQQLSDRGAEAVVTSICEPDPEDPTAVDFSGALQDIAAAIATRVTGACLPRPLNPDPSGFVECRIIEVQPENVESCDESRGRFPLEPPNDRNEDGRLVCEVQQVLPEGNSLPTEPGWFYDTQFEVEDCPEDGKQRITFTEGAEPGPATDPRLECLQSIQGSEGELINGSPCDPGATADAGVTSDCKGSAQFGDRLECNPDTNTCMIPCEQGGEFRDDLCGEAGLRGFVCDFRNMDRNGNPNSTQGFCVDPTCT